MGAKNDFDGLSFHAEDWSDPYIGRQVVAFFEHVQSMNEKLEAQADGGLVLSESEHLCEWSRNLLNDSIGRTSRDEILQLSNLFGRTADLIEAWLPCVNEKDEQAKVKAYSFHIRRRTGLVVSPKVAKV